MSTQDFKPTLVGIRGTIRRPSFRSVETCEHTLYFVPRFISAEFRSAYSSFPRLFPPFQVDQMCEIEEIVCRDLADLVERVLTNMVRFSHTSTFLFFFFYQSKIFLFPFFHSTLLPRFHPAASIYFYLSYFYFSD